MANKRLPGGRKSAGRISTSAKKLVALKAGSAGVAISELPDTEKLTGKEFFPVVQDNETRKVPLEELSTLISVDGINAQGGNFCLSPVAYRLANSQGYPTSFRAEYLNEAISVTYRIYFATNGYLRLDFSKWDFDFNESQSYKIILTNNSSGEFSIIAPGNGLVINNDGAVGEPEIFKIDTNVTIIEITQSSHDSKLILRRLTPYEPGKDGESAYSFWASKQPEGADISDAAFLKFMEGKEGEPGKSAYQLWLDAGNEGTEDDFLEWLQVNASVEVDPLKTNLVKLNADGLFVNGVHPIIPKFSTSTLNGLLDTFKSLADGTRVYTMQVNLTNPLGITQLGGVGIHRYLAAEPQYFFTNENGEYIPAQYFITGSDVTAASVKVTISVIMSDKPYKAWDLSTLEEVASIEGGAILQCKVGMRLLAGTTPSQNGMS
ncbi:hypothetical protein [Enterobacter hormaechei]|uniref:hypothetical protein n=1 Tax=Enterobacter hormaechei TaxID=158836 RepID=UPI0007351E52|nr:hypothetical protein [Enterobacter hormaechei]KTI91664.1 hypothetical protein ASU95_03930 [Enterobacter hormaechei subsp. hoffmannii]